MMMTFWEWLGRREQQRLFREGDEGYQAFIDQSNRAFRTWIESILRMGKFTDPRNEAEAREIVSAPDYFNYARELLAAAAGGRARLRGRDMLDGAQEVGGQLWMTLLNPKLYEAGRCDLGESEPVFRPTRRHPRHDPGLGAQRRRALCRPPHQAQDWRDHPSDQPNPRPRQVLRPAGPVPGE